LLDTFFTLAGVRAGSLVTEQSPATADFKPAIHTRSCKDTTTAEMVPKTGRKKPNKGLEEVLQSYEWIYMSIAIVLLVWQGLCRAWRRETYGSDFL
jgi:hypothetical protein